MTDQVENLKSELEMSERKLLRLQRLKFLEGFEAEDLSLWTMLDLMTLILVFFIVLYADLIPLAPPAKLGINPATLTQFTRTGTGHEKKVEKTIIGQERSQNNPVHKNETAFLDIEESIHLAMEGTDIKDYSIKMVGDRIILVIGEKISFPVGQAKLLDPIKIPLEKMADFLYREQAFKIVVSGHTDDTPIHTSRFPSNWELSLARAMSVANFLMAHNLDPRRICVEGFGQYNPIADNTDPKSRQTNRRVEISLIPTL